MGPALPGLAAQERPLHLQKQAQPRLTWQASQWVSQLSLLF